jgi:hypothetical protein
MTTRTRERKPFTYRGCIATPEHLPREILVGCNNSVNRYLRVVWRVTFPDQTWIRCGTKHQSRQYIDHVGRHHGATP